MKRECKVCHEFKDWVRIDKKYVDENNKLWNGRVCNVCHLKQCKQNYKYIPVERTERKCIQCGSLFIAVHKTTKFCSKKCWHKSNPAESTKRSYNKQCMCCDKLFIATNPLTKYCSEKCKTRTDYLNSKPKNKVRKKADRKKRKARVKQACPNWVSLQDLVTVEKQKPRTGWHLDHIIPINHPAVCGLHVPWNLQWLPDKLNEDKSNKFDFTYNNESWKTGSKK